MKRKIIFIGGMPTAGKTTIARQVAEHFDLPCLSGDQIRVIMQSVADKQKYPLLFSADDFTAEEFLTKYSPEEIAEMEYNQGYEAWQGVRYFVEHDWVWKKGCVIEGVSILPPLIHEIDANKCDVKVVFLSDSNHDRIRHVVYNRGLYDDAKLYSDNVKDKEIKWVKLFDKKLREDASNAGYSVIEMSKDKSDIEKVLSALSR